MTGSICETRTFLQRPSLDTVKRFRLRNLEEKGMLQYFYHSPSSRLPVRDVRNELRKGHKTEPHIEVGAENYLCDCYQKNIQRFLRSNARYLFLLTMCRNKEMREHFGKQYIVGYTIKEEGGYGRRERKKSWFVRGSTKLFEFKDSISSEELFGGNLDRAGIMHELWIDEEKTKKILNHFKTKRARNILLECVREIIRLDKNNETCYDAETCKHRKLCLRLQNHIV